MYTTDSPHKENPMADAEDSGKPDFNSDAWWARATEGKQLTPEQTQAVERIKQRIKSLQEFDAKIPELQAQGDAAMAKLKPIVDNLEAFNAKWAKVFGKPSIT